MEFGLLMLGDNLANPVTGERRTTAALHRRLVDLAVRAAARGIDVISLGEHRFSYTGAGKGYVLSAPHVVLAAIAERTERVILGNRGHAVAESRSGDPYLGDRPAPG